MVGFVGRGRQPDFKVRQISCGGGIMREHGWLKNLAEAKLENGVWVLSDPSESRTRAEKDLTDFMANLMVELEEAVQIFNSYKPGSQKMRLLREAAAGDALSHSLVLLLGAAQVRLVRQGYALEESMSFVKDYQQTKAVLDRYVPSFDAFGGLRWQTSRDSIITIDDLIKTLLHHVCRAAYLAKEAS